MYNNVALAVIPSGIKSSIVYSLIGGNMTFARGSSATRRNKDGLIEYVDTSVPRLDYDGAIPHLLLEPDRSNLIAYSEDFDFWTQNAAFTEYFNYDIAPDGNKTADRLLNTSGANRGYYRTATGTTIASRDYTFSVFAKGLGLNKTLNLSLNTSTFGTTVASFNLNDGTVASASGCVASIEAYRDGWYRLIITAQSDNTNSITPTIYSFSNDDVLIWGAQVELGSFATSYIPRLDTDIATRTAETCDSGTGDFNSSEGVLFAEIAPLADDGTFRVLSISDGTPNNRVSLYYSTTSQRISASLFVSTVGNGGINYDASTNYNQFLKIAYKYKKDDFALWVNGVEVGTNPAGNTLSAGVLDIVNFTSGSTGNPFYGKIRQAVVFNSALTDSQLAELTR